MLTIKKEDYLFWIIIFLIVLLQLSTNNNLSIVVALTYSVTIAITLIIHIAFIGRSLKKRNLKKILTFKSVVYILIISVATSFILTIEGYFITVLLMSTYIANLLNSEILPTFFGLFTFTILTTGVHYSIELFKQNILSEKKHEELKNSVLEMEIDNLRKQLSPHFTFNILNNLQFLIRKDKDEALELLSKYSKILRYYVYESENKWIKLENEIAFLKDYFELEKDRSDENLQVNCKWNIPNNKLIIIPFLLSTFVENAFKHISISSNKNNYINFAASLQNENELLLIIENSYDKKNVVSNDYGVGLKYVQKRLDLSYKNNYKLNITQQKEIYRVQLKLNLSRG